MKVSAEPIEALLIDWDGTLIDSLPLKIANAAVLFAERFGADRQDISASYSRHSGVPRRILFDRISSDCIGRRLDDDEFNEMSNAFTEQNRLRIAAEGRLRDGTIRVLSDLKERGVLLFISTSAAQEEIDSLSHHFGIDRVCAGIFGSRPSFSKGREHALEVMNVFELDRRNLAGIGDDIQDMILFAEAGIRAIGITGTRSRQELEDAGSTMVIDRLDEVIAHVG